MKKIITLGFILLLSLKSFAQTDGISYQAVIIGPDVLELPGVDSEGNYFPNATVLIKFTIFDSGNAVEFEEVQTATTDDFGRINLIIGAVEHDDFEAIEWDGTGKDLQVEIDFQNGDGYADMSREVLTFVPYAYHRDITATGTLIVDDNTTLRRELVVDGPTSLNSTLDVYNNNATNLSGDLTVDGLTNLNNTIYVNNKSTSNFSGALNVGETTGIEDVDAPTVLNGTLNVVGKTTVTDFEATGQSTFNELTANTLEVIESTILNGENSLIGFNRIGTAIDTTLVQGLFEIDTDNQIKITSTLDGTADGSDLNINNYPLLIESNSLGIAIKVNNDKRNANTANQNNFISFWDDTAPNANLRAPIFLDPLSDFDFSLLGFPLSVGLNLEENDYCCVSRGNTPSWATLPANGPIMWGRIEGETEAEFGNNADYNLDKFGVIYDALDGTLDLAWQTIDLIKAAADVAAAATEVQPCVGFGACVTGPAPSNIAASLGNLALEVVKEITAVANEIIAVRNYEVFNYNKVRFRGVTYASGAGDYAEYLLRQNYAEKIGYGDIVGVRGGKISKRTLGAERMMVVSYKPIVLGNMPQENQEDKYEKVAFMGQVPVKVFGVVNIGDYIVPSTNNDGLGVAIAPNKLTAKHVKSIVGVAWEASTNKNGFKLINVAVGINNNDSSPIVERLEKKVEDQAKKLNDLKALLTETINRVSQIENGVVSAMTKNSKKEETILYGNDDHDSDVAPGDVTYYVITDEDINRGLELAEKMLEEKGLGTTAKRNVFNKINTDAAYKAKIATIVKQKFNQQYHYHKEVNKKAGR